MLHNTRTEQYVNNIRKWKRIESQKVRERFRVKIWAVVIDNLWSGLEVMGMNSVGLPGDNFMVGNMVTLMVRVTITIRG